LDWEFPAKEFPHSDLPKECAAHEHRLYGDRYPDPQPRVYEIDNPNANFGNESVPVDVVGQGFVKGKMRLAFVDSHGMELPVSDVSSRGTYRCGHISAKVTPNARSIYRVRAFVDAGTNAQGKRVETEVPSNVWFTVFG